MMTSNFSQLLYVFLGLVWPDQQMAEPDIVDLVCKSVRETSQNQLAGLCLKIGYPQGSSTGYSSLSFYKLPFYGYGRCRNYRTEVEEYEGTVIYRTLLFYNSVFLGRCEKKTYLNLLLIFFVIL